MSDEQRGTIPQKIKGFRDIDPAANRLRGHIIEAASGVYKKYGFEHWDTPALEYTDCIGKYLPDADSAAEGVYSFRSPEKEPVYNQRGERLLADDGDFVMENHFLSLRYDLTAPLSRLYAERVWNPQLIQQKQQIKPPLFRRYQYGPVYRFEAKLDPGRFREFWQLDFDSVGAADIASDAEVCMVLADALEAIGLKRGTYRVKVSNRKILKGILAGLGITDEAQEQAILRIIDKVDKIGVDGVEEELGAGRKDPSGAFIPGLNLHPKISQPLLTCLTPFDASEGRKSILQAITKFYPANAHLDEGIKDLNEIDALLSGLGFAEDRVVFDPSLVRGMAYYTGPVFEVESLLTFRDEKGRERRVGSICGGGRYDGLVERMLGLRVPATGASIGVDRLGELLQLTNALELSYTGAVLITVFDTNLMPEYQKMARELRDAGIAAEVYYGINKGLKKQLAYADEAKSPVAILLGEDEAKKGVVTVRNLRLGAQLAQSITDKNEWREKVQREVPRAELVAAVAAMLE